MEEQAGLAPVSVNWHVWPRCNYACDFCYAAFKDIEKALPKNLALRVPSLLAQAGVKKITFAGGEPTLCPHLSELLAESKRCGMTTMIVTNGSRISSDFLSKVKGILDWVTISVDSSNEAVQARLGRGHGQHVAHSLRAAALVREAGIRLKLNTVVTSLTWQEDMSAFVRQFNPERWKVFQMLPVQGENDSARSLPVTADQFGAFAERHRELSPIAEDNDAMTGTYLMMDPLGRFFQNWEGKYRYSASVLDVGVGAGIREVGWDQDRFVARGGLYKWANPDRQSTDVETHAERR